MAHKAESGVAHVFGGQPSLPNGHIVSVECDITKGLHAFAIVGLPDKAVEEAKDRVSAAIKNSKFESPKKCNKKIVVSLAPAELKKEGAVFDIPIALSFLLASKQLKFNPELKLFAGELSLDGHVCPIRGTLSLARAARDSGFQEIFVPEQNADEASLVSGITVYPIRTLLDVARHLAHDVEFSLTHHVQKKLRTEEYAESGIPTLDDIRGQETAKRAVEIASAGRHNIALYGPPGTGKTMLARATVSLLPPLTEDEMLEVTTIHSLAGILRGSAVLYPPFRSPHHTSSYASLIGGGSVPRPGEVTLAHRGVLFLDEFPEFHRDVVQALREPLEDGRVSVSRAKGSTLFPAHFMLVAALN
ncbi:MAG TPA: YifB family Mg chelatase-like AAA ATPase, partial [Candidatus Paceibacterota bacterium]